MIIDTDKLNIDAEILMTELLKRASLLGMMQTNRMIHIRNFTRSEYSIDTTTMTDIEVRNYLKVRHDILHTIINYIEGVKNEELSTV